MGGPQRALTTYKEVQELIKGTADVAGLGVRVAPVMVIQRANRAGSGAGRGRDRGDLHPLDVGQSSGEHGRHTRANRKARAA